MSNDNIKAEYLAIVQRQTDTTRLLVDNVRVLLEGGVESFQTAILLYPEMVIATLESMADLIELQNQEFVELTEQRFQHLDDLESIRTMYERLTQQIQ